MKVLLVDNVNPIAEKILEEANVEAVVMKTPSEDELCKIISDYDGIILRNHTHVTRKVMDCAGKLKVIARAGVGVDNIDVDCATEKGIWVINSPDGNTEATAEHTIAMILAVSRKIPQAYELLKTGVYERTQFVGNEVFGKKLGIIGLGKIGSRVAEIAKVLGMDILVFDPYADSDKIKNSGYKKYENFDEILADSDYITVHVPKNKNTLNLINKDNIYKIKKGAKIINCARGGIVNEDALKEAVQNGHISGAALDVFVEEPEIKDCPLYQCSNSIIMVPHLGASTVEAQTKVAKDMAEQIVAIFNGQKPKTPVNKLI